MGGFGWNLFWKYWVLKRLLDIQQSYKQAVVWKSVQKQVQKSEESVDRSITLEVGNTQMAFKFFRRKETA